MPLLVVVVAVATTMSATGQAILVPSLPGTITIDSSSLYNLWTHALRYQKDGQGQPVYPDEPDPQTILSPVAYRMINLAPQDSPHPLYSNEFIDLRTEFLRDYMIQEHVSPDDARMLESEGLTVKNLNGKPLTFKKDAEGKISVEGIEIEEFKTLQDGLITYTLSDFLFNHQERADEARKHLLKNRKYDSFGRRIGMPPF